MERIALTKALTPHHALQDTSAPAQLLTLTFHLVVLAAVPATTQIWEATLVKCVLQVTFARVDLQLQDP
jgi:hypothetical protein